MPVATRGSTLSAWLTDYDVSRSTIGFFSWVGITYSIKFFWAPVVDRLPLPLLTRLLGKRRSWMLAAQICIALGLSGMALTDPGANLTQLALFALLVAFGSATAAVSAAVEIQLAMRNPVNGLDLPVRIGLHSGTATVRNGDYFGGAVNRAARISASAHAHQIVVSQPTVDHLGTALPDDVALLDLGIHRLRGLAEAHLALNNGIVGSEARDAFRKILANEPELVAPRFWLAVGLEQDGVVRYQELTSCLIPLGEMAGRHLVTVNLFGTGLDPDSIEADLRRELVAWFGAAVEHWERLKVYRLPDALPRQAPPVSYPGTRELMVGKRLWCCAELGGAPSIQWALHSGSRAGAEVAATLLGGGREASRRRGDS